MRFELKKYNIDQVSEVLADVGGHNIIVNDIMLSGVKKIIINNCREYLDDLDTEGVDIINFVFEFEKGTASQSFYPDTQYCGIVFETENLWIFNICDLKEHLKRQITEIELEIQNYDEVMSK